MFTGIIEEVGTVEALRRGSAGARLNVSAQRVLSDLVIGGSVAVNGVCLTAVAVTEASFAADLSPETLEKTNLGSVAVGTPVNLERPLSPSGRLSGHFVQGHVDGTGEIVTLDPAGDGNWLLEVRAPQSLLRYLVFKGSIAIDGISLTLAAVDNDVVSVAVIPHTYEATSLHGLRPGVRVNIECDMLAKHIEKLLATMSVNDSTLSVDDLRKQGF